MSWGVVKCPLCVRGVVKASLLREFHYNFCFPLYVKHNSPLNCTLKLRLDCFLPIFIVFSPCRQDLLAALSAAQKCFVVVVLHHQ